MGWRLATSAVLGPWSRVRLRRRYAFFIQQSGPEHGDESGSNRCSDQDGQHSDNQHSTRIRFVFRWLDLSCHIKSHGSNSGLSKIIRFINQSLLETIYHPAGQKLHSFHTTQKFISFIIRPRYWFLFSDRMFQSTYPYSIFLNPFYPIRS